MSESFKPARQTWSGEHKDCDEVDLIIDYRNNLLDDGFVLLREFNYRECGNGKKIEKAGDFTVCYAQWEIEDGVERIWYYIYGSEKTLGRAKIIFNKAVRGGYDKGRR